MVRKVTDAIGQMLPQTIPCGQRRLVAEKHIWTNARKQRCGVLVDLIMSQHVPARCGISLSNTDVG